MLAEFLPPGSPPMLYVVSAFLALSLLLYCLLGGADFGAGILELFLGRERRDAQRKIIERAMGPVWEANHMWLILMVVILFVGFPAVYARVSIHLHIPLTAMLLGIIARGCAFTFRHYDAVREDGTQRAYTGVFALSSAWTPFFLGVSMGALVPGKMDPAAADYYTGYVAPWLSPFPLALGLFTMCLFTYVAAVYLIGESADGELRASFMRKAAWAGLATVVSGGIVFLSAPLEGFSLLDDFLASRTAQTAILAATVLFPWLWVAARQGWVWTARALVGAQVTFVLLGWFRIRFPVLVNLKGDDDLTFFNAHAPAATLDQLGWALLIGSLFILPALVWLFRVFKGTGDGGRGMGDGG
jgi:cytochrome bd ubiquinol oxidase subunit II